ncbi:MAG: hypothetical protein ACOCUH_04710, partial [Bacteriovoracia bacterium]
DKGAENHNMKLLRGACVRILISNPKNYTLLILKAFSEMFLELNRQEPSEKQLLESVSDLSRAYLRIRKIESLEAEVLIHEIDKFYLRLSYKLQAQSLPFVQETIEYLKLRIHSSWLQEYNQMFNADDKRPDTPRTAQFAE